MAPVLLSRGIDPLLGIFTGVLAFYLNENHPRTAPPPDQKLMALIQWKLEKRKAQLERAAETAEHGHA